MLPSPPCYAVCITALPCHDGRCDDPQETVRCCLPLFRSMRWRPALFAAIQLRGTLREITVPKPSCPALPCPGDMVACIPCVLIMQSSACVPSAEASTAMQKQARQCIVNTHLSRPRFVQPTH